MTKKNRHFKKSRKNVRRKRNQVGGEITATSIANLSKIATTGIDVIITLTEKNKCHTEAVRALKEIVEDSMDILKELSKNQMSDKYVDIIKRILRNLNKMITVLSTQDISSMVELLWTTLDNFGELVEKQSNKTWASVNWVHEMRKYFTSYINSKTGVTTIDVSIAKLLEAQLTFANDYMGANINASITTKLNEVNVLLQGNGKETADREKRVTKAGVDDEKQYSVLKVLIASLVCTLQETTKGKWNFKEALEQGCTIISYLIEGNIFNQNSFSNTLNAFSCSLGILSKGASFSLVFASTYIVTYAKSYTDHNYKKLKTCNTLKDIKDFVEEVTRADPKIFKECKIRQESREE